jgi:hypothetical protein
MPSTKSWAVTSRAGLVFQRTPERRWMVQVLPSALMPPLARVGTSVATSATGLLALVMSVVAG